MEKIPKNPQKFECKICDYISVNVKDYKKHLLTNKHQNRTILNNLEPKIPKNPKEFICSVCQKCYKAKNSLWYHEQKCFKQKSNDNNLNVENDSSNKELIMLLIKENSDLKNMMLKVIEKGTHSTTNHNINNSNNKAFNLNFFLNETCKDAMNITDFVDFIKPQLSDLIDIGELGYVDGISKIIVKNLNSLDETIRPIHCTDKKRETFYVKDQNQWEKEDENKTKLKKIVKHIANKNIRLLPQYRAKFPDYNDSDSIHSDEHSKIVIEAMICDNQKDEKIIKNISNATTIHK